MAGTVGQSQPDLIQELLREPEQFEFFQAVRLIERAAAERARGGAIVRVGGTDGPDGEAVRFRALQSLTFPPGQIAALKQRAESKAPDASAAPMDMTVSFMGLTGPAGALPEHYTTLVIERTHLRLKDYTLREFLDLFNHRFISLYFRAWEKYRFQFACERRIQEGSVQDDLFTQAMFSLVGMGSRNLLERMEFEDQAILYFGGLFADRTRNAVSLEQILSSYFGRSVEVEQFQGQWLYLPEDTQSAMPSSRRPGGLNLELGQNAVAGSRVWDVSSRIRIRIGPLTWAQFLSLLPGTRGLKSVADMVRLYSGIEIDFDVQLLLRREDVPQCRLSTGDGFQPRLGWNTWLGRDPQAVHPAADAVFRF